MTDTYAAAVEWLFKQLPIFQLQGKTAFKPGLERIRALCSFLEHPEKKFPAIHIGGTNGKGSVSHMMAAVLQAHGKKVGLYTSPHLVDFRERIRIDGKMISEDAVTQFVQHFRKNWSGELPSFFELGVAMALDHFAKEQVDVAVVEVGMGGRLDATSIVHSALTVVTNIGLDHTQYLGETRALIAAEKAAIARSEIPMILGEPDNEILPVFEAICKASKAPLYVANQNAPTHWKTDLPGHYQKKNLRTLATALPHLPWKTDDEVTTKALLNTAKVTGLRGRWQILSNKPLTIVDTAHNKEGLKDVMQQLKSTPHDKLHIVFGVVADKNIVDILPLLPLEAKYYLCAPDIPRALAVEKLATVFRNHELKALSFNSVREAFSAARKNAGEKDIVYGGGSTFVVGEILANP